MSFYILLSLLKMENIVEFWLKSVNLGRYYQNLLDNGYDDLETCKRVKGAHKKTDSTCIKIENK